MDTSPSASLPSRIQMSDFKDKLWKLRLLVEDSTRKGGGEGQGGGGGGI